MSDLIHNEQTKLLATGLNTIAVIFIVVGVVTPLTAMSFGVASAPSLSRGTVGFALIWFSTGAGLHWTARRALRSLKP